MPGIITTRPSAIELGHDVVPILPGWILSGSPVTRVRDLIRSRDWMSRLVIWECTAGTFNWRYCQDEMLVVVDGEVFVTNEEGEERRLGPGDLAFFPAGSSSTWRVPERVRKVAVVRETMWRPLGFGLKVWKRLVRMTGFAGETPI